MQKPPAISALTVTEILTGIKNKREKELFLTLFNLWEVFPVTHEIAELAGSYRQVYYKSHGISVVETIISAEFKIKMAGSLIVFLGGVF